MILLSVVGGIATKHPFHVARDYIDLFHKQACKPDSKDICGKYRHFVVQSRPLQEIE